MPPSQNFDEKHLRDVVLAQSEQIKPARRFSGLETLTRPVVALAAIVALVAIALGIKDYVQPPPSAGTASPNLEQSESTIASKKKITSAKTGRMRMSSTEATADTEGADNDVGKPLIRDFGKSGTKAIALIGSGPNSVTTQTAYKEREATDPTDGTSSEDNGIAKPGSSTCLPLPNGTQPGDIDAPYYLGWATEYCGHDLSSRPKPPSKVRASQSKK